MFKRHLGGLLACLIIVTPALAQERSETRITAAPVDARFEIIQSDLLARITLLFDKYAGLTYQLVRTRDDAEAWQPIPRLEHPRNTGTRMDNKVNYQIFTSGRAVKFTYLINLNNGATWQWVVDSKGDNAWEPLPILR